MAGFSLFLIAAGAILRFGVSDQVEGVDLSIVGVVLMVVGVIGLVLALVRSRSVASTHSERVVSSDGRHVVEETRTEL